MTAIADNNITDVADGGDIRYDPYDAELNTDPHPTFSRIRENAPLYNYAVHVRASPTRRCDAAAPDHETFSSARGAVPDRRIRNGHFPGDTERRDDDHRR